MTEMNQAAQQPVPAKTGKLRRWPWIAALIVALATGFAVGSAGKDVRGDQQAQQLADLAKREQAAAESRIARDGIYLVGKDIAPGTYRTAGSGRCYWKRSSGTSGDFDEIIANGNESGQAIVTIASSDVAFTTKRCGAWELVN